MRIFPLFPSLNSRGIINEVVLFNLSGEETAMKFLKNLWGNFAQAVEEFIADLLEEDTLALTEVEPDQVPMMVETDSFESWK
jgi:hypothetical protein